MSCSRQTCAFGKTHRRQVRWFEPTHADAAMRLFSIVAIALLASAKLAHAGDARDGVEEGARLAREAEARRIATIDRVAPTVVCVYDEYERGGGSGVIIDPEGYGLTNYHVVAGMMGTRRGLGGLSDGRLYSLEVLGIDPTGDVAMFKLVSERSFPYSDLGDSDAVRVGDPVMAIGNPFVLSEDYTPTVTLGLVTGVQRYQWGVEENLAYTDCLQTDASINPGNSGGPLFNMAGEVVGINGRISINTRGRFNVGFGYSISSNQIKRFIPTLRAGLLGKHGTMQATVERSEDGGIVFGNVRPDKAADRAGLLVGDQLVSIDGRAVETPNRFASVLGTYPASWPLSVVVERDSQRRRHVVRLDPIEPKLRGLYNVDREANLREAKRVVGRFVAHALGARRTSPPSEWKWTIKRAPLGVDATDARSMIVTGTLGSDGTMNLLESMEGSRWSRSLSVSAATAVAKADEEGGAFELMTDEKMTLQAVHALMTRLLALRSDGDWEGVSHAGGDVLVDFSATVDLPYSPPKVLETIQLSLGSGAEVDFGFDPQTGLPAQAVARDRPSGIEVVLQWSLWRDVDGVQWPTRLEVRASGRAYVETWESWSLTP